MNRKEVWYSRPPADVSGVPNNLNTPDGQEMLAERKRLLALSPREGLKKRPKGRR